MQDLSKPHERPQTSPQAYDEKYRGQWGGKIDNGEEMWWSGYWKELDGNSAFGRWLFRIEPRHRFLIEFFQEALSSSSTPNTPKPVVIDYGCGSGGSTLSFSKYIGLPIDGYDIFPTQLKMAESMAHQIGNESRFHLIGQDGRIPLEDSSVDVLFSSDVLAHVPDIPKVLQEWTRVLKAGGRVVLYTEARTSPNDPSLMNALYRKEGIDMIGSVPEHISLYPKEELERMFSEAGLTVERRLSGTLLHPFFAPREFVSEMAKRGVRDWRYCFLAAWDRLSRLVPFFPKPFHLLKISVTRLWGAEGYGSNYFYLLRKSSK